MTANPTANVNANPTTDEMNADPVGVVSERLDDLRTREPEGRLPFKSLLEVYDDVERRGRCGYLIEGIWPADAYGGIGGGFKVGKTWAVADLTVSLGSGTPWLGRFACTTPGNVLYILGEGGERNFIRRIEAVAEHKGMPVADLFQRLRLCPKPPRLKDPGDLDAIARELERHPAVLTIIDPGYLALAGAKGSDLYSMGEVLGGIQQVSQDAGSALLVTWHWNKGGEGTGAGRFTGVGPAEWGRVLGSASLEQQATESNGASVVSLLWEFSGSEIPETKFRMRRRVGANDPLDLASPLHYDVEVTEEGADLAPITGGLSRTRERMLAALSGSSPDAPLTVREIGDRLARDGRGKPLMARTIQTALNQLSHKGLVDGATDGAGTPGRWWLR